MEADNKAPLLLKFVGADLLSLGALFNLAGLVVTVLSLHYGPVLEFAGIGLFLLALGSLLLVLAKRQSRARSIGIRIDERGISGLLLPVPLQWSDIAEVTDVGDYDTGSVRMVIKGRAVVGQKKKWGWHRIRSVGPGLYAYDLDGRRLGMTHTRLARISQVQGERHGALFRDQD